MLSFPCSNYLLYVISGMPYLPGLLPKRHIPFNILPFSEPEMLAQYTRLLARITDGPYWELPRSEAASLLNAITEKRHPELRSCSLQDDAPACFSCVRDCSDMDHRIRFSFKHFLCPGIHLCLHPGIAPCQIQFDVFDLSSFFSHTSALSIGKCSEFSLPMVIL